MEFMPESDEKDQLKEEAKQAERAGNLQRVAEIQYSEIRECDDACQIARKELTQLQKEGGSLLKDEVTEEDIAAVVSRWTGVPVTKMISSETEKLAHLETKLAARVIGQKDAIKAVSNAVRR